MKKYLLKRLLRLIPVFLGVTILAFLLTGLSSVDAVDLKESSSGGVMSEAEKEAMREELGLNEPKAVQYLQWLKNALQKEGVDSVDDVFLCIYQNNGMFVIKKEMNSKDTFF